MGCPEGQEEHHVPGKRHCCISVTCPAGFESKICVDANTQATCKPCNGKINYMDVQTTSTKGLSCKLKRVCNNNSGLQPRTDDSNVTTEDRECKCIDGYQHDPNRPDTCTLLDQKNSPPTPASFQPRFEITTTVVPNANISLPNNDTSKYNSAVIGAVLSSAVLALLIVMMVILILRRRKNKKTQSSHTDTDSNQNDESCSVSFTGKEEGEHLIDDTSCSVSFTGKEEGEHLIDDTSCSVSFTGKEEGEHLIEDETSVSFTDKEEGEHLIVYEVPGHVHEGKLGADADPSSYTGGDNDTVEPNLEGLRGSLSTASTVNNVIHQTPHVEPDDSGGHQSGLRSLSTASTVNNVIHQTPHVEPDDSGGHQSDEEADGPRHSSPNNRQEPAVHQYMCHNKGPNIHGQNHKININVYNYVGESHSSRN